MAWVALGLAELVYANGSVEDPRLSLALRLLKKTTC